MTVASVLFGDRRDAPVLREATGKFETGAPFAAGWN